MSRMAFVTLLVIALCGCVNKSGTVPRSGLVLMAAPTNWESLIGTEVQIIGAVSRNKVPTILGVEIDAARVEPGQRASATGIVDAVIIEKQDPTDPPLAMRGPGTYYRLIDPRTNRLAVAEAINADR